MQHHLDVMSYEQWLPPTEAMTYQQLKPSGAQKSTCNSGNSYIHMCMLTSIVTLSFHSGLYYYMTFVYHRLHLYRP